MKIVDVVRASFDIPFFAQQIFDKDLHDFQIKIMQLAQDRVNESHRVNGVGSVPRQVGLSTAMALIAAHTIIFGSHKHTIIVEPNAATSTTFRQRVEKFVADAVKVFGLPDNPLVSANAHSLTGRTSKVTIISANDKMRMLRGMTVTDIFIDTAEMTDLQLECALPALHSTRGRVFAYSTGRNKTVDKLANHLVCNGMPVEIVGVDPLDFYSMEYLGKMRDVMGDEVFAREFLV